MIPGQRFELDLDGEDEGAVRKSAPLPGAFVGDVLERRPAPPAPPKAPTLKSRGGFPEHRKGGGGSKFAQTKKAGQKIDALKRATSAELNPDGMTPSTKVGGGNAKSWEEQEKERIDLENRQKLAHMSSQEIEDERAELMDSLSPALLQRLLQRSNIESGSLEQDLSNISRNKTDTVRTLKRPAPKTVSFADPEDVDVKTVPETHDELDEREPLDDQAAPLAQPLSGDSVHFPRPSQPPDLDPSSATFLEDLHTKYFPSLPSDPDKLAWMQPSTTPAYDPSAAGLAPKDLRFSFSGELLAPRSAAHIPVSAGLHHHGDAPDAAGYTIAELARLAHSSFAAQRCIAFQTLGRFLYRLGRGEFGDSGEPGAGTVGAEETFGELARGLWREVEKEGVIDVLVRESEGRGADRGRHVSARAYATEAVWLWRKGGGRRWKAE